MEYRSYYARSRSNLYFDDGFLTRNRSRFDDGNLVRDRSRSRGTSTSYTSPLRVISVDTMSSENASSNHTAMFNLTQRAPHSLILRRGESFDLRLSFSRAFDEKIDEIGLILTTGRYPRAERRSEISVPVHANSKDLDTKSWSAYIVKNLGSQIEIRIQTEPDAIIGVWSFSVVKLKEGEVRGELFRYDKELFMLFNPYHYDDAVCMEDKQELKEYFLKQTGEIYIGSKTTQVIAKPWNFGQFQDEALMGTMLALNRYWDEMRTREEDKADPVKVSRALTTIISNYVLRGNWTTTYTGGTNPSSWSGSVRILREFVVHPTELVNYGQCWVFAGVLCTMLRTLGIPSRVITNLSSAHDGDRNLTIDAKYAVDRSRSLSKHDAPFDQERVWNFHVWNEGWMRRSDLKQQYGSGYDGWQVLDATRQELSEDCEHAIKEYECGPMPVAALRESNLTVPYDGPFIYAEFNADYRELIYRRGQWGRLELISINTNHNYIGQGLFTTSPYGKMVEITDSYKPSEEDAVKEREGYEKARKTLSMKTAGLTFRNPSASHSRPRRSLASARIGAATPTAAASDDEEPRGDVEFEMTDLEEIAIGDHIVWTVTMRNNSEKRRSVKVTSEAHIIDFMGKEVSEFHAMNSFVTIPPRGIQKLLLDIPYDTFEDHLGREWYAEVCVFAVVQETEQMFRGSDKFNVKQPHLKITTPAQIEVGTKGDLVISIVNPFKTRHLTNCEIAVEANGLALQSVLQITKTIAPGQELVVETSFGARYVGETLLIANFCADELQNVAASKEIEVVGR